MSSKILVTLGPSSLHKNIIEKISTAGIYLFRLNLSHTPLNLIEEQILKIQKHTDVPICIDSEGAQIRSQTMNGDEVLFQENEIIKIHSEYILGDSNNISFSPNNIVEQFNAGDEIQIDFNAVVIKIIEKHKSFCLACVITGGKVGSNKAVNLNRSIKLPPITKKDIQAIKISKELGVLHFALSFANSQNNIKKMRSITGNESKVIAKIESRPGLFNLEKIIKVSDEILIDRGDLSRQIPIEKIPFLQRRIISICRSMSIPVHVATNLLETMVNGHEPSRAEINDVVSTLQMGANGLVLAAETAIGKRPVKVVEMVRKLIVQYERWTPNTSILEIMNNS